MCSIVADTLWRCLGLGAREKFDFCFFFTKTLLVYDIVTDFLYWNGIRDDESVPSWARWLVLLFACCGVLLDCVGSFRACTTSPPESWGKDEDEASNRYQLKQRKLGLAMIFVEDLPQIALSSWITYEKQEVTNLFLITVAGSLLNMLRVILLNCTYISCAARAKRIMEKEERSLVRIRICGCYTLFSYKWSPIGYFGDMDYPQGGTKDLEILCCCR